MSKLLFVSDVHITPQIPSRFEHFRNFLDRQRNRLSELYLLGDVFEYWIGPRHLRLADYRPLLDLFRDLTRRGTAVHLVPGNRDYLVCEQFSRSTGIRILPERHSMVLDGRKICLLHGDRLYNRDPWYVLYRNCMSVPWVKKCYTSLPPLLGRGIASSFRSTSQRKRTYSYPNDVREVIEPTRKIFDEGFDMLICGHIHKPQHLTFDWRGKTRDIFVLGDWDAGCDYVEYEAGRWTLRPFRLQATSALREASV